MFGKKNKPIQGFLKDSTCEALISGLVNSYTQSWKPEDISGGQAASFQYHCIHYDKTKVNNLAILQLKHKD